MKQKTCSILKTTVALMLVISTPIHAQTFETLHQFAAGAIGPSAPAADLIQGTDGDFYGTTQEGGVSGAGTVYRMTTAGAVTTLFSFSFDANGRRPGGGLIQASDGNFYGTTQDGGLGTRGTVFKITPVGALTTLVSFDFFSNGANPQGALVQGTNGDFYGTTVFGGASRGGTVYRMTAAGVLTTLVSFGSDIGPQAGLIQGVDGNFYGTMAGIYRNGAAFKMTPTGGLNMLVSFTGPNGDSPQAALTQGSDGNFYGTTGYGGANGYGTVFRMTPAGAVTTLVSFNSTNGANPRAGLVQGNDGNFYGTTDEGGFSNYGTVFRMTPVGALTTLVSFNNSNGRNPRAGLVQGNDGNLYGTTIYGGSLSGGTVFRINILPSDPGIFSSPQPQLVTVGSNATFNIIASGTGPFFYQWRKETNAIAGATVTAYTITNVQMADAASYSVILSNHLGSITSAPAALTVVLPPILLAAALEASQLTWTSGGDENWVGQSDVSHDGVDAAQSGSITHSQQSWMETTVIGPGPLSFWWKVSSEVDYDYLEFYINGVLQTGRISGNVDWQQKTYQLGIGNHLLRWRYAKDGSVSSGQDRGWVDTMTFVPPPPPALSNLNYTTGQFSFSITGPNGASVVVEGSTNLLQWAPLQTNILGGSPLYFSDPQSATNATRYYRLRTP